MLKIWGRRNSINVQKAMWIITELGLAHQRVDAGMQYGTVNEPWYRAMNPNGRVPTIDDDGFILWESNTVVRYLAATHGAGNWCPADLRMRADAERWMDWCTSTVSPVLTPLFWGLIRTPPEKRDPHALAEHAKAMEALAVILDAQLAKQPYLAGERICMGDIPLGCFIHRWYALPVDHAELTHLKAWYARLAERPAFREHVMLPLS